MDDLEQLQLLDRGGFARIPRAKVASEQQKLRLEAEEFILQNVTNPFLCRGFEVFETTEEVALLQEFIEGRALYECVWKYRDSGKFPENVAKFFAAQLVVAVRDLHAAGFVHRDLKSGNVLVGKDGFVKVIDFGLAKTLSQGGDSADRTQSVCGTHYIMAPEMFHREPYGNAIDWWSLGVVVYEMVAGQPPWEYKCPPDSTMTEYFARIERIASALFQADHGRTHEQAPDLSDDLQCEMLACCGLLRINPDDRLGRDGATEVMQHAWFHDVDWEILSVKGSSVVVPYDPIDDYNAARVRNPPPRNESLSSEESTDPEENANYFADF